MYWPQISVKIKMISDGEDENKKHIEGYWKGSVTNAIKASEHEQSSDYGRDVLLDRVSLGQISVTIAVCCLQIYIIIIYI